MKELTIQQRAVIAFIADATSNPGHLVCDARAGSGKTSTMVQAGQGWELPGIAVAFNKPIATELSEKMPSNFLCRTINSVGLGSFFRSAPAKPGAPDTKKALNIHRELGCLDSFPGLRQAYMVAREWGIAPNGALASPESILPDTPQTWARLFDEFAIDLGSHEDPIGACREALLRGIKMAWKGIIDFTDQKYMPAIYEWTLPKAPLVMVDEAQDLSPIDRKICQLMLAKDGRLIAIGDQYQAIYGFRGADRKSISNIIEQLAAAVLPLTVSFRCPRLVIAEAQKFVPDIESGSKLDGTVRHLDKLKLSELPPKAAFLCRNNKPLVALYFRLIKEGIPSKIRGRDIGAGILKMLKDTKRRTVSEALQTMWQRVNQQVVLLQQRDMPESASLLTDKAECAQIIGERVGLSATIFDFEREVEKLFADDSNGGIILSTVHKAKGLEWPTVFILDPFLMPSKYAKTEEARAQERNLQYVAVTRSQNELFFINTGDIE